MADAISTRILNGVAARMQRAREQMTGRAMLTTLRVTRSPFPIEPEIVNVELTNLCNQKCAFCPTGLDTNSRPKGQMEFGTFRKLVDGLTARTRIQFAGYGEPFLHKELERFLDYAAVKGLNRRLQILTNLSAIQNDRIRGILDHPFHKMYISLDATTSDAFLAYKRVNQFNLVRKNIETLADEVHRRGIIAQQLIVQMVVTNKNQDQRADFERYVHRLGMQPKFKTLNTFMSLAEDAKIREFQVPELSRYGTRPGYSRRCSWPWSGFILYWNGDVSVCCEDPLGTQIYGNILESTPTELLNSDRSRCGFREKYFQDPSQIEICRGCNYA